MYLNNKWLDKITDDMLRKRSPARTETPVRQRCDDAWKQYSMVNHYSFSLALATWIHRNIWEPIYRAMQQWSFNRPCIKQLPSNVQYLPRLSRSTHIHPHSSYGWRTVYIWTNRTVTQQQARQFKSTDCAPNLVSSSAETNTTLRFREHLIVRAIMTDVFAVASR